MGKGRVMPSSRAINITLLVIFVGALVVYYTQRHLYYERLSPELEPANHVYRPGAEVDGCTDLPSTKAIGDANNPVGSDQMPGLAVFLDTDEGLSGIAMGGARAGRFRQSRMRRAMFGSSIAAIRRIVDPQRGQRSASISKTRSSRAAQRIRPPRSRMAGSRGWPSVLCLGSAGAGFVSVSPERLLVGCPLLFAEEG